MKKFPILYKRAATGKIQQWQIVADDDGYYTISGQVDGKLTTTKPHICTPKNEGKKNSTTAQEQALSEAQSKHDYKLEHGHAVSIDQVDTTGYLEPMRAHNYLEHKDKVTLPIFLDDKLNGIRCITKCTSVGLPVSHSRRNKQFHTLGHIHRELLPVFKKHPNLMTDGELFNPTLKNQHGRIDLGDMTSLVSVKIQPKDVTPELLAKSEKIVQYWLYDGLWFDDVTPTTPFEARRKALQALIKQYNLKYTFVLPYKLINTLKELEIEKEKSRVELREGLILRYGPCHYEWKRSDQLLKYKNWFTEEFEIVDLLEGTGDWAGHAKKAILQLPQPVVDGDGKTHTTFSAGIEGNMPRAKRWLQDKKNIIGKLGSVTFAEYSKDNIPVQGVLETIRDYE